MNTRDNLFEEQNSIIRIMNRKYTEKELKMLFDNKDTYVTNINSLGYYIARDEIQHIAFRSKVEDMPLYINDKSILIRELCKWRIKIGK